MEGMFYFCKDFNQSLNNWSRNKVSNLDTKCQRDLSNVKNGDGMFAGC
jgi:hypothetical protein